MGQNYSPKKTSDYVTALVIDINNKGSYTIGRFLGHPVLFTPKFHNKGIVYKHKKERRERTSSASSLCVHMYQPRNKDTKYKHIRESVQVKVLGSGEYTLRLPYFHIALKNNHNDLH